MTSDSPSWPWIHLRDPGFTFAFVRSPRTINNFAIDPSDHQPIMTWYYVTRSHERRVEPGVPRYRDASIPCLDTCTGYYVTPNYTRQKKWWSGVQVHIPRYRPGTHPGSHIQSLYRSRIQARNNGRASRYALMVAHTGTHWLVSSHGLIQAQFLGRDIHISRYPVSNPGTCRATWTRAYR